MSTIFRSGYSGASGIPGFVVQYEFSPLMIRYEERRQHLITFLVSLCAIIGGFTGAFLEYFYGWLIVVEW
ncbi:hypothetical protein GCK32_002858 [Trichostrongylus colubriformis]|uniref:Endoplasmic reticulum vesicle transporter C-terminal domain-containing protein n=1 Tax=Trichostrongylus colubriformis TaxID=6319 RepID=A0AAN8EZI7_TRICO